MYEPAISHYYTRKRAKVMGIMKWYNYYRKNKGEKNMLKENLIKAIKRKSKILGNNVILLHYKNELVFPLTVAYRESNQSMKDYMKNYKVEKINGKDECLVTKITGYRQYEILIDDFKVL